ncbi:hypothetical protein [Mucilaginibacter sp.]|uniref:hypothetical protein n=1 Tax=Mucilaginibacter sp. TaxID=1882438 RepID=UPI003263A8A5
MTTIEELNKKKVPVVKIDESLDKYDNVVLFPEKLAKANEMLRTIGLPKDRKKSN